MRFMVTHSMDPSCTKEKICESLKLSQTDPNVKGYRTFLNLTQGRGVCLFDAPDRDRLARWLNEHQMSYDDICEVELEADHDTLVDIPTCTPAAAGT